MIKVVTTRTARGNAAATSTSTASSGSHLTAIAAEVNDRACRSWLLARRGIHRADRISCVDRLNSPRKAQS